METNDTQEKTTNNIPDENFIYSEDPYTFRVRGEANHSDPGREPTDPHKLSRAILHAMRESEYVRILSVGPKALNITMQAFRLAAQEVESRTNGSCLVCRQAEYDAIVGNNKTKGTCTRIFGIPIKYAL
jgi:stage V sporulation protein SpoVS